MAGQYGRGQGLYRYKNETLVDQLRITPEEERHMKTLISTTEKYRRRYVPDTSFSRTSRIRRWYGMPRTVAFALTALSRDSGRRILMRDAFFSNSKRTGVAPE